MKQQQPVKQSIRRQLSACASEKVRGAIVILVMADGSRRYKSVGRVPMSPAMKSFMS